MTTMAKAQPKPKLTDAERHERFKDMAKELGAEGEAPGFDRVVGRVAKLPRENPSSDKGQQD
jgi:hypothetical protein